MKKTAVFVVLAVTFVLGLSSNVWAQNQSDRNKTFWGFGLGLESLNLRNDPGPSGDYSAKFNFELGRIYILRDGGEILGEGRWLLTVDNFVGRDFNVGLRNELSPSSRSRFRMGAGAMLSSFGLVALGTNVSGKVVVVNTYRDWSLVPYFHTTLVMVKDKSGNGNDLNLNLRLGSGVFSFNRNSSRSQLGLYKSINVVSQVKW